MVQNGPERPKKQGSDMTGLQWLRANGSATLCAAREAFLQYRDAWKHKVPVNELRTFLTPPASRERMSRWVEAQPRFEAIRRSMEGSMFVE